jgi:hypothetical protein
MSNSDDEINAAEQHRQEFGTEKRCPKSPVGHVPDWSTVAVSEDGGEVYIDVACMHCGRSGCLGTMMTLVENLSW